MVTSERFFRARRFTGILHPGEGWVTYLYSGRPAYGSPERLNVADDGVIQLCAPAEARTQSEIRLVALGHKDHEATSPTPVFIPSMDDASFVGPSATISGSRR